MVFELDALPSAQIPKRYHSHIVFILPIASCRHHVLTIRTERHSLHLIRFPEEAIGMFQIHDNIAIICVPDADVWASIYTIVFALVIAVDVSKVLPIGTGKVDMW